MDSNLIQDLEDIYDLLYSSFLVKLYIMIMYVPASLMFVVCH